jgi:CBS domain-containing protein
MRAQDVMTRDVSTVSPDTPLTAIADLLLSRHISGVPVVEPDGRLVGVISEADLMWRAEGEGEQRRSWWASLLSGRALKAADFIRTHGTRAEDVMSRSPVTVSEDTPIEEVIDLFERRRIKRLPVVRGAHVVGIVSRSDLLKTLARQRPFGESQPDDDTLQDELGRLLTGQPWYNSGRVNMVVENGVVNLSGLVASDTERRALHVAAHSIPGVRGVEDNLTVQVMPSGGV